MNNGCRGILSRLPVAFGYLAIYHTTMPWVSGHLLNTVILLVSRKLYMSVLEEAKLGGAFILGLEDL